MNLPKREYGLFLALVSAILAVTVITQSPFWYLTVILLILFSAILILTLTWRDRAFYLVCGGEPLVIVSGMMNIWAGCLIQCLLVGIICIAMNLLTSPRDQKVFLSFCGIIFLIGLLIGVSNHVYLPLLILGAAAAAVLVVRSIRHYQFRKQYNGV